MAAKTCVTSWFSALQKGRCCMIWTTSFFPSICDHLHLAIHVFYNQRHRTQCCLIGVEKMRYFSIESTRTETKLRQHSRFEGLTVNALQRPRTGSRWCAQQGVVPSMHDGTPLYGRVLHRGKPTILALPPQQHTVVKTQISRTYEALYNRLTSSHHLSW